MIVAKLLEGALVQWCNPLTLQLDQPGGMGSRTETDFANNLKIEEFSTYFWQFSIQKSPYSIRKIQTLRFAEHPENDLKRILK